MPTRTVRPNKTHIVLAWQAGVAESRWAIEYEQPAADAFKLNYPDATVFCNNCNVLLMVSGRAGD